MEHQLILIFLIFPPRFKHAFLKQSPAVKKRRNSGLWSYVMATKQKHNYYLDIHLLPYNMY